MMHHCLSTPAIKPLPTSVSRRRGSTLAARAPATGRACIGKPGVALATAVRTLPPRPFASPRSERHCPSPASVTPLCDAPNQTLSSIHGVALAVPVSCA